MENIPLFPKDEEPWLIPDKRPGVAQEALRAAREGDFGPLLRGFAVYLARIEGMKESSIELHQNYTARFLRFLQGLKRSIENWERDDFLLMLKELADEGVGEAARLRFYYVIRAFLRFLEWAGIKTPDLDLQRPTAVFRQSQPYTEEEYRRLLDLIRGIPSSWRMPLLAITVLVGETGLRYRDVLGLTLLDVDPERGEVRLPGGTVSLSPTGKRALQDYFAWRRLKALPGYDYVLVTPRGKGMRKEYLGAARHAIESYTGVPYRINRLRLTGQSRLVRRYGTKRAKELLRRVTI